MKRERALSVVCVLLTGVLCFAKAAIPVHAEELAGYHEKTTTETEATDTWYSVARGTYLGFGTVKIIDAGKGRVTISGSTNANSICDELKLTLYLDESSNNSSYGTIATYRFSSTDDVSVSGVKDSIRVTSGYYYRNRGVHTVVEGSTRETTDTCTNAIKAS